MTLVGPSTPQEVRPGKGSTLPPSVTLTIAGLGFIFVLVVGAIAVRSVPFAELDGASRGEPGSLAATTPGASQAGEENEPNAAPEHTAPSGSSRELRARLGQQVRAGKLKDATDTLESLVTADPRAAEDADVRGDLQELASKVEFAGGREADRVFGLLSSKMGTLGPDVLYSIVTSKGGSKAATRAASLLKQDDVRQRATPGTRIAFDLWAAKSCPDKAALLQRAKDEGDARTLGWLQVMARGCHMSKDEALVAAMTAIKERMR